MLQLVFNLLFLNTENGVAVLYVVIVKKIGLVVYIMLIFAGYSFKLHDHPIIIEDNEKTNFGTMLWSLYRLKQIIGVQFKCA